MRRAIVALGLMFMCASVSANVHAIGRFDVSNITVTPSLVRFDIANLDRSNDGDHGGYDGTVIFANIYCSDTDTVVAQAPGNGIYNSGDTVSFAPTNYDGSPHTGCYARIYTNAGTNDYQSVQSFAIPAATSNVPTLDESFDEDGKVVTSFGNAAYLGAVAAYGADKLVAVGSVDNGSNVDWRIGRYNTDGSLDTSFGNGGLVQYDSGNHDSLDAVVVLGDGKILVGGYTRLTGNFQWTIARYNADGTLDTGFGDGGIVKTFAGQHSLVQGMKLQADGKIVATGYANTGAGDDVATARYNTDGSLDAGFGNGGTVTTGVSTHFTPNDRGKAVAIQSDGKIVVFVDFDAGFRDQVALLRYNADGSLDSSFGSGGRVIGVYQYHHGASDVAAQPDGKVVVTGYTSMSTGGPGNTYVVRYNNDGTFDTTFGPNGNGRVVSSFSDGNDYASALVLKDDSKILIAGVHNNGSDDDVAVRQFNADGSLDASFGSNGSFTAPIGQGADSLDAMVLQSGKIVAGGTASNGSYTDWAFIRLLTGDEPVVRDVTLTADADSYVQGGQDHRNKGASTFMRLQSSGSNRSLVRFDQAAIESAVGEGTVLSAKLRVTITDNGDNWGAAGRTIDAHRLLKDWAEGNGTENDRGTGAGSTWSCASDSQIANQSKDCSGNTEWEMGQPNNPAVHPWAEIASATQTITSNQSGVVEFDVTNDVASFVNGGSANYGWLFKKTAEGQNGMVAFGTKESTTPPQLVITYEQ